LYDAGEAAIGIKHLLLLKKPDAFQLGSDDPDSPKVQKTLGQLGVGDTSKIPKPIQLVFAQLAFSNSDLAFQGNHLFMGNFYGVNIYDISDPSKTRLLTSMQCPGGQGDVSVYKNLLFMSVEMPNGRWTAVPRVFRPILRRPPDRKISRLPDSAERSFPRSKDLRYLRHQESEAGRRRCKPAAARTRILWSSIRRIRIMSISTFRELLSSVRRRTCRMLGRFARIRIRIRHTFASK
jgi:hypothetical protein